MAAPSELTSKFPILCPSCGQQSGNPAGTSDASRNDVTVTVRCSRCEHSWNLQTEQDPIITPKADRRKSSVKDSVLIVDDEPDTREILARLLAGEPYTVHQAANADDAERLLAEVHVSVVLCDQFMPGRDGLWLMAHMREHFPHVAIILATADDSVPPRFTLQPGVVGYLVKPFNPALVLDAVRNAMAWHQTARRRSAGAPDRSSS